MDLFQNKPSTSSTISSNFSNAQMECTARETTKEDLLKIGQKRVNTSSEICPSRSKLREALSLKSYDSSINQSSNIQIKFDNDEYKFLVLDLHQRLEARDRIIKDLKEQLLQIRTQRDSFKLLYDGAKIENQLLKGTSKKWTENERRIDLMKPSESLEQNPAKSSSKEYEIGVKQLFTNDLFVVPKDES
ncbi:unnamed protein product, partial [Mesorhabditis belari]|uniref:Uncharacterized protein n=1 Tax=Mesorhabditis belari TaxID=2138241 RepID=A0AAF3E9S7_9BILA